MIFTVIIIVSSGRARHRADLKSKMVAQDKYEIEHLELKTDNKQIGNCENRNWKSTGAQLKLYKI